MIDNDILAERTESYIASVISEITGSRLSHLDTHAPFQELGIDSFYVLKIIKALEDQFGVLPKTLLYENFNIHDLSQYFIDSHKDVLMSDVLKLSGDASEGESLRAVEQEIPTAGEPRLTPPPREPRAIGRISTAESEMAQAVILSENIAYQHETYGETISELEAKYKNEGSVSRGAKNIAPNIFLGSERKGYLKYSRTGALVLVYVYVGPEDYFFTIIEEFTRYCSKNAFQLNLLSDRRIESIGDTEYTATPFGVMQRLVDIEKFSLKGSKMRRLRYLVTKFEKIGECRTEEYVCGSDKKIDEAIAALIDRWASNRSMVNPLVFIAKEEILNDSFDKKHRIFLTYVDDKIENVIIITSMSQDNTSYLMDLEFYSDDMPLGGLEFGIVNIINTVLSEGAKAFSLGATFGPKICNSPNADPQVDELLDSLREQNVFNDEGNLQFKNKFRTQNDTIYLCRAAEERSTDAIMDIILMIADPSRMQTSDEANYGLVDLADDIKNSLMGDQQEDVSGARLVDESDQHHIPRQTPSSTLVLKGGAPNAPVNSERYSLLKQSAYNPMRLSSSVIELDLKTDSWAELDHPSIDRRMQQLNESAQLFCDIESALKNVFPFRYFSLTESGRRAEEAFYKSWKKKGKVLQNLLFPTSIFHQIDSGFDPVEIPDGNVFSLDSQQAVKGNICLDKLKSTLSTDGDSIALICVEVSNNASGGYPTALENLKQVRNIAKEYSVPLVIDATRILENAEYLRLNDKVCADKTIWELARELLVCADVVIASLPKDFAINKGGLIATNDLSVHKYVEQCITEEGFGLDILDKKIIGLSFSQTKYLEAQVLRRMENVELIWEALHRLSLPVLKPKAGHCVVLDVKQIDAFSGLEHSVASFLAWLFLKTGIRAAEHNVGMQKGTELNGLVRLAIPVGLSSLQTKVIIDRLTASFENISDIPVLEKAQKHVSSIGKIDTQYTLTEILHPSEPDEAANPQIENKVSSIRTIQSSPKAEPVRQESAATHKEKTQQKESTQNKSSNVSEDVGGAPRSIAIVGMAGRYPQSKNMDCFWDNLMNARDCISDLPQDRFDKRVKTSSTIRYRGGFIDAIDRFDSLFFNVSPREAEMLDPQERLFLEVAWETIEDAGYYPDTLTRDEVQRNVGVYVGAVWSTYQIVGAEQTLMGNELSPNSFLWSVANRVSYYFNLSGPSMTVDTACSSSLTAIYLACEAIKKGECFAAIAGGVNLDSHQTKQNINLSLGALSEKNQCRAFGSGADGYVPGEGIGAVFLKSLDDAVADRDNIYGVIKSAVVNHGGRTSGYTVPNPKAHTNLVAKALEEAGVDARTIGYIEAHGTGTELGDPIEITGLSNAFQSYNVDNRSCSIGSVKSNIGHLEAAAGVVGVSKILHQIRHQTLVPSLHSSELNEFIDFENSPFVVQQEVAPWLPKQVDGYTYPLRAGISSFGAGGANAHLIIEEFPLPDREECKNTPLIFPLSARNATQLREISENLLAFLKKVKGARLDDIAYTLQLGRKSFENRVAIVAASKKELVQRLQEYINGETAEYILSGESKGAGELNKLLNRKEKEEFIQLLTPRRDPLQLAQIWSEGLLADWQGFKNIAPGRRISLPTYPFADKRHWISTENKENVVNTAASTTALHPMIDANESTFARQLFRKRFHDQDFFIYDHVVSDIPTLPGVAYLELVRKAGEIAAGRKVDKIQNIIWLSPITVENGKPLDVYVELLPRGDVVQFEVFSENEDGNKQLHSQGRLLFNADGTDPDEEYIDIQSVKSRSERAVGREEAYPLFHALGLNLGPSFQGIQDVYKNDSEILGALKIPQSAEASFKEFWLHPSLVDSSFQSGMAAQLVGELGSMFVPFSISEVEIRHPLSAECYSYVTQYDNGRKTNSNVSKINIDIVDASGKVLIKIKESVGVPLQDVHEKSDSESSGGFFKHGAGAAHQAGTKTTDGFEELYYTSVWEHQDFVKADTGETVIDGLILFDNDDLLLQALSKLQPNARIVLVQAADKFELVTEGRFTINPQRQEDFESLFDCLNEKGISFENICVAWEASTFSADTILDTDAFDKGVYALLYISKSLMTHKVAAQIAYVYDCSATDVSVHNEAINGYVKTLQAESPKIKCKTVELRGKDVSIESKVEILLTEFKSNNVSSHAIRWINSDRLIKKIKELSIDEQVSTVQQNSTPLCLKHAGVYIITGGAGGLGLIFAKYLAENYSARLVLTGRSSLSDSDERKATIQSLSQNGAEAIYIQADVSLKEDVDRVVTEAKTAFGSIDGIIHAAGVIRDAFIRNKTTQEMQEVFAPKIAGTIHLDEATKQDSLDFFVLFSSMAAIGGNAGQSDYSYANSFMDSYVLHRESLRENGERHGKSLSINWSIWESGGMTLDDQAKAFFEASLGIRPLKTEMGLSAFEKGIASHASHFVVVEGMIARMEKAWGLKDETPIDDNVKQDAIPQSKTPSAGAQDTDGDLYAVVRDELSKEVVNFLKLDASDIEYDKVLLDFGFDSIGLSSFATVINDKYDLDLTPVLFFEYPSIQEIAGFLSTDHQDKVVAYHGLGNENQAKAKSQATVLGDSAPSQAHGTEVTSGFSMDKKALWTPSEGDTIGFDPTKFSMEDRFAQRPIAIVGMSGVMPQSDDLDEFWQNLHDEKNLITVIPHDRWDWEAFYGDPLKEDKSNSKWGGFMRAIDRFDPLFFGISPREAELMDPQQRILLETVWKTVEDSGHKIADLAGSKTGLFIGVATNEYSDLISHSDIGIDAYASTGNSHSVLVNRISFLLDLHGPSAPLDTACSSSLVALHRAIESIHTGSSEMAIVGGVQIMIAPAAHIFFGKAGMLSDDGKCKTFDKSADGYVRGEGVGAIFIKPLSKALEDGNNIYAVVKATAENHGGKANALTAPNPNAQSELLVEAYEKAHVDPSTVGYIECHGTGTSLGDPIENQALKKAFSELYKKHGKSIEETPHCGLGSVKTNIGHLETAAGIAGIFKVLLAIKNKKIPASLHLQEINPYIELKGSPFYIVDKTQEWAVFQDQKGNDLPRRAGVSSFGFGGANAHIVLEEFIPTESEISYHQGAQLIVLSARNENRLRAYVELMAGYLRSKSVNFEDFVYTLQLGRDEMYMRLAFVASSVEETIERFEEFLRSEKPGNTIFLNNTQINKNQYRSLVEGVAGKRFLQAILEEKDYKKLAELWVSGVKVDWAALYGDKKLKRLAIPTYPFARDPYWLPQVGEGQANASAKAVLGVGKLHSLVHQNISTLSAQKFLTHFSGDEFYFTDHVVETEKVLPGVAYMEMARVAGEFSADASVRAIRNLVWMRPIVIGDDGLDVEIQLSPNRGEVEFSVESFSNGESICHCMGKLVYSEGIRESEFLNIDDIKSRCVEEVIRDEKLYPLLSDSGLKLGKSFQIVKRIYATATESLAVLALPDHLKKDADHFCLHPALMDGSLHTAIGLILQNSMDNPLSLPFSVGEVEILHPLTDLHYGYATWSSGYAEDDQSSLKINFELMDKNGLVLVRMKDFFSKPFSQDVLTLAAQAKSGQVTAVTALNEQTDVVRLHSLIPGWNPIVWYGTEKNGDIQPKNLVAVNATAAQLEWLKQGYPNVYELSFDNTLSEISVFDESLIDFEIDQLMWFAPDCAEDVEELVCDQEIIERQEQGVLALFRIVKGLLAAGYVSKPIGLTIMTRLTQHVLDGDKILPTDAGVIGLVGSLAKEFAQWKVRLLDVDDMKETTASSCLSLPWDQNGDALALRQGEWYAQSMSRAEGFDVPQACYRENGVYVVIGGAGGLGEVWSEYMITRFNARVIWIGRRPLDEGIQEKINKLAKQGSAPIYISADAGDYDALHKAYREINTLYPTIHGVIHSAIVLQDQNITAMDENRFRSSLDAKVNISVNMARVFGDLDLDFMLFFSSIVSFMKTPGQSNYAAGCTFKDSFAQELDRIKPYPVKTMNWGYWGNVGIVADESYNRIMEHMGIASIEIDDGMHALETLIGSPFNQTVLIKTSRNDAIRDLRVNEVLQRIDGHNARFEFSTSDFTEHLSPALLNPLKAEMATEEMDAAVAEILAAVLNSIGLLQVDAQLVIAQFPENYFVQWFERSLTFLKLYQFVDESGVLTAELASLDELWTRWAEKKRLWINNDNQQTQVALIEACLKAVPDILLGKVLATDVLFPESSMRLVEGVYKGNPIADYFNKGMGLALQKYLDALVKQDPDCKIRILEIGAGTGGTTAQLMTMLRRYEHVLEEYCYTDLSKAFLMYGEKMYKPECPALVTEIFDVTKPLAGQNIQPGQYDVVIATNVLHATPNIRETLKNTKATLKTNGLVLLNEIADWASFSHLTFGLLEGWWLHEDTSIRIPGSPGIETSMWKSLLESLGYTSVFFPCEAAHFLGQQILTALSDGLICQSLDENVRAKEYVSAEVKTITSTTSKAAKHNAGVPGDGLEYVKQVVIDKLGESLKISADAIHNDVSFVDYGVDSIVGVNLIRSIGEILDIELETIILFDYSTVNQLADYIWSNWQDRIQLNVSPAEEDVEQAESELPGQEKSSADNNVIYLESRFNSAALEKNRSVISQETPRASDVSCENIAIIGMSGRFAESETLDDFWKNLSSGTALVKEVKRWSPELCAPEDARHLNYCTNGSFIDSIDQFDPLFFKIPPVEAQYMDPQQRLFLEEAWKAIEDAGYAGGAMNGMQCGVYVGCGSSHYLDLMGVAPPQAFWGNSEAVLPARIAYYLNLQGPAVAIDTACSSSLVTIHLACLGLRARETDMALAGGVFLQATPGFYQAANRAGMLSPGGQCFTFDSRADGFVPGEGVGAVLLKRLGEALQDGDVIHGTIIGSGINQDGSTNGIVAPSAKSQERLECSVYDRFNINPESITLIEAHGTGTQLGDPIEFSAITRAFRKYTDKKNFCAIGSVKTNIGHAATAAGVAGVLKILLALKNKQVPPSLHYENGNSVINFDSSPFYVSKEQHDWEVPAGETRRAAISSFGFSGTNAHIVIEEAPVIEHIQVQAPGYLIALSAYSHEQLKKQAKNLLDYCDGQRALELNDVSYTLMVGRPHLTHRLACVVKDKDELMHTLAQWLKTGDSNRISLGEVQEDKVKEQVSIKKLGNECIEKCKESIAQRTADNSGYTDALFTIADLFSQGYRLDFVNLFDSQSQRLSLPTYPFAKERYWIESDITVPSLSTTQGLHPLIHENTSSISQYSYGSSWCGNEVFIKDYSILNATGDAIRALPASAYIEMIVASVARAVPLDPNKNKALKLCDLNWSMPISVDEYEKISTTIFPRLRDEMNQTFDIEIFSQGEDEIVHAQSAVIIEEKVEALVDSETLYLRGGVRIEPESLYAQINQLGVRYGATYQGIVNAEYGENRLLVEIALSDIIAETLDAYTLHPAILECVFQASVALINYDSTLLGSLVFPKSVKSISVFGPCQANMWAFVQYSQISESENHLIELDVELRDSVGKIYVRIEGLSFWNPTSGVNGDDAEHQHSYSNLSQETSEGAVLGTEGTQDNTIGNVIAVPSWREVLLSHVKPAISACNLLVCGLDHIASETFSSGTENLALQRLTINADADTPQQFSSIALACFEYVKGIVKNTCSEQRLIQIVFPQREAQLIANGIEAMLKTLNLENPHIAVQMIAVSENTSDEALAAVIHGLRNDAEYGTHLRVEPSTIADQPAKIFSQHWQVLEENVGNSPIVFKNEGVYLITGGLGGIGQLFVREIMKMCPNAKIIVTGRSALTKEKQERIDILNQGTENVEYRSLDLNNEDNVIDVIQSVVSRYQKINGVLHLAGMTSDNFIQNKSLQEFEQVLVPKVHGTVYLDRACRDIKLDFFALFSSGAACFGNLGQADYALANAFMDSFAQYRQGRVEEGKCYGASVSINWPIWQDGGMSVDESAKAFLENATGMTAMQTSTGMKLFYRCLILHNSHLLVMEGRLQKMLTALQSLSSSKDTDNLDDAVTLAPAEHQALREKTESYLVKLFSEHLKIAQNKIGVDTRLDNFGIDSLQAIALITQLEKVFGPLKKTLFYEYTSISELSSYLVKYHASHLMAMFSADKNITYPRFGYFDAKYTLTSKRYLVDGRYQWKADDVEKDQLNGASNVSELIHIDENFDGSSYEKITF